MLTEKMGGIFDCRKYDQSGKLSHDQRQMLADTDNITFSALLPIDQVPGVFYVNGQLDEFAKPRASRREREAAEAEGREPICDVVSLKFKIGQNANWFDEYKRPMDRPTNADLEKDRYNVQIDFARKEKDPSNPMRPSGYWVNSIMVQKVNANPFANVPGFAEMPQQQMPASAPVDQEEVAEDDLPFGDE